MTHIEELDARLTDLEKKVSKITALVGIVEVSESVLEFDTLTETPEASEEN